MNEILLQGCQSQPLAGYLKALGVLRLVGEQIDPEARGCWGGDGFILHTILDSQQLESFFLDTYVPTPVIAPWNGGSGYYPSEKKQALDYISSSESPRFADYAAAIATAQEQVKLASLTERPKDAVKNQLLNTMRASLGDDALIWIDAAVSLSGKGQKYPPLLGTGGNDARFEFAKNFMERICAVIEQDGSPTKDSAIMLGQTLFERAAPHTQRGLIGHFSPGAAGNTQNGSTGFDSSPSASPWDYVLTIEGAMLFAAATVRRMESTDADEMSFPFTTQPIGAGSGATHASDEANAKAEIWLPLWSQAAQLKELRHLFNEGRVTLGRRSPRNGLEFARAVSQLGITRGITAFERYTFLKRAGDCSLATPIGRFDVPPIPRENLLGELEQNHWLSRFDAACRDKNAPARLRGLQRPLRDQMFALTQASEHERPHRVQAILQQLGEIERYAARSPAFREQVPPVPNLSALWSIGADDNSHEFRIAEAVAGLHIKDTLSMRELIAPSAGESWSKNTSRDICWQHPEAANCMVRTLNQFSLRAQQASNSDHGFTSYSACNLLPIAHWIDNEADQSTIHHLVPGLAFCRLKRPSPPKNERDVYLPYAYSLLKLLFCGNTQLHRVGLLPTTILLPNPRPILRQLQASNTERAIELAQRRLRAAGLSLPEQHHHHTIDAPRLSAALLIPIHDASLRAIAEKFNLRIIRKEKSQGESA